MKTLLKNKNHKVTKNGYLNRNCKRLQITSVLYIADSLHKRFCWCWGLRNMLWRFRNILWRLRNIVLKQNQYHKCLFYQSFTIVILISSGFSAVSLKDAGFIFCPVKVCSIVDWFGFIVVHQSSIKTGCITTSWPFFEFW